MGTSSTEKLEKLKLWPERTMCKFGARGDMAAEEINASRKKPSTLYKNKKKDALKPFQELARPYPLNAQGSQSVNL